MSSDARYLPGAFCPVTDSEGPAKRDAEDCRPVDAEDAVARDQSSSSTISDELLLAQVREGSRDALGLLFRRHARAARNIACRILKDAGEAEDLVQEVFLFVFRRAALFDPAKGSARSWLVQVAYHRAFDRRRYLASRHHRSNLEIEEAILGAGEPAALTMPYENTLEGALGGDALRRIEESLSDMQRRVLYLHFYEGHTVNEIASIVGQSVANVRNHYYRALEKIRCEVFNPPVRGK